MKHLSLHAIHTFARRALASAATRRGGLALVLVVGTLVGLELVGRGTTSDVADLLALLVLGAMWTIAGLVRGGAWEDVIESLGEAGTRLLEAITAAWPDVGIDLTNDGTTPTRVPKIVVRLSLFLLASLAVSAAWGAWSETPLRPMLAPHAYLVWLALVALLWAALLLIASFGALLVVLVTRQVQWLRAPRTRRSTRRIAGTVILTLVVLALYVPVEVALVPLLLAIALPPLAARALRIPRLTLLWRTPADGAVHGIDWSTALWQEMVVPYLGILLVLVWGLAGAWTTSPDPLGTTPVTTVLARGAAWLVGPVLLATVIVLFRRVARLAREDPAAPCPTTVHITPIAATWDRGRVEALLGARGWSVRFAPDAAERTDVRLVLVDPPAPPHIAGQPLAVSERGLQAPELLDFIERRDVLRRRRILRRGLERVLKAIRQRDFEKGTGTWLAPHLWWADAATRDSTEDDFSEDGLNGEIGIPFADALPLPARHHLHVVLRTVEVDLILLEDGVRWSAFRRVLERIFSHVDRGRRRIEEHHFVGIPGVSIVLHELEPGGTLEVEGYPEPDYEDLARGRILHVFRDRGGEEDVFDAAPTDDSRILLPA